MNINELMNNAWPHSTASNPSSDSKQIPRYSGIDGILKCKIVLHSGFQEFTVEKKYIVYKFYIGIYDLIFRA